MRRVIIVGVLVVVLAAAFVIPAVAAPTSFISNTPLGALRDNVLSPVFGVSPTEDFSSTIDPNNSSSVDPASVSNSSVNPSSSSVSSSSDPSFSSSSSSDPSNTSISSGSSDPAVDPPGVSQKFSERRVTSGSASPSSSFSNSGDNVNACPTTQQVTNTGNVTNQQGASQYNTSTGDIDASGSSITITPSVTATCDQSLNQAAGG